MQVRSFLILVVGLLVCGSMWAEQWTVSGPEGGEVRSLASDPQNPDFVFLGTSSGTIFRSTDSGHTWSRCAHLGRGDDYVIDHIAVDPQDSRNVYVAVWSLANRKTGDLFRSLDGGKAWWPVPAMRGRSIRSMVLPMSHPGNVLVGTLDGIFRSKDGGVKWKRISAPHTQIRNVDSVAVDPGNENLIYAGTRHLAWKTTDGGVNWRRIDKGMIDDSDVFSIIIDPSNPQIVFAGACSGIYKSRDGGLSFERIQRIPFSARRTRILRQDPNNPSVIYAGTTEGLWVTSDLGEVWKRVTSPAIVVNDILIDPRNGRVLLATDHAGVLVSDSHQLDFQPSNSGFAHRYISSILADQDNPNTVYVGVLNDRELGGVFVSNDAGGHWRQQSAGLEGKEVFVLKQTSEGAVLAGTNDGLFIWTRKATRWSQLAIIGQGELTRTANRNTRGSRLKVNDIEITSGDWLAGTPSGLYISSDEGETWSRMPVVGRIDVVAVCAQGKTIAVASPRTVLISTDKGNKWRRSKGLPSHISGISSLIVTSNREIIVAAREGAFHSRDLGSSWQRIRSGLPRTSLIGLFHSEKNMSILGITSGSTAVFLSNDRGLSWSRGPDAGVSLRRLTVAGGRIVAATTFDGVIIQRQNDDEAPLVQ